MNDFHTIAVVGATGRQGGAVARHLLAGGARVRAVTRTPDSDASRELRALGAEVVAGDLENAASLDTALRGTDALFAVTNFWDGAPGPVLGEEGEARQGIGLVDAAKRNGTRYTVLGSAAGAFGRSSPMAHVASKQAIEKRLMDSGMAWTIIRPTFFMENLLVPWMGVWDRILEGELALPMADTHRLQMVSTDDIGAFAALAFDDWRRFDGSAFDLAGDELTGPEMARTLSDALGRPIRYTGSLAMIEYLRADHPESAAMWDETNAVGTNAFVPALRGLYPGMRRFADFLAIQGLAA